MTTKPDTRAPDPRKRPREDDDSGTTLPPLPWLIGGLIVLTLLVGADAVVDFTPHFGIDGLFGFHALYGLLSGLFVVIVAKIAGIFLKRTDTYYDAD